MESPRIPLNRLTRRAFLAGSLAAAGVGWLARARISGAVGAADNRRPVILVHGFGESTDVWRQPSNAVVMRLRQVGYAWETGDLVAFAYPALRDAPDREDSRGDIRRAAAALADQIQAVAASSPDGRVALIGFSMGGLVIRAALATLRERAARVDQLVAATALIGTPNNGLDMLLRLQLLGQEVQRVLQALAIDPARVGLQSVAAQQMLPNSEFLRWLNGAAPADLPQSALVAGSLRLVLPSNGQTINLDIGDGLVSAESATYLPGARAQRYVVTERLELTAMDSLERVARATVLHPNLPTNDAAALAAVSAIAPWADALRPDFERTRRAGVIAEPAAP